MIKRIELVNFMSHERTVIEPSAGLTVLIGPNNCGKSAFVSALQILCHNVKSNYVMRHGGKKCEITVETDDGHVVKWSRTKSGSPKYLIDGQEYDRLKQGVPAELHEALGLAKVDCDKDQFDVHFGEQKSPVFLLNDPGKAAAQFFASSSDAIRLVEMQDRHKGKVRDSKRDQTSLIKQQADISASLELLKPVDSIEQRLTECETRYAEIQSSTAEIKQTEALINDLDEVQKRLAEYNAILNTLKPLESPPELADTKTLEQLIAGSKLAKQAYERFDAIAVALSDLMPAPELKDTTGLSSLVDTIRLAQRQSEVHDQKFSILKKLAAVPELVDQEPLGRLLKDCAKSEKSISRASSELKEIDQQVDTLTSEIEQWVEANPTCPTCGGPTTMDQLIGSGGGHQHG